MAKVKLTEKKLREMVKGILKEQSEQSLLTVSSMKNILERLEAEGHGGLEVLFEEPNEYYLIGGSTSPQIGFGEGERFLDKDDWEMENEGETYPGDNVVVF